MIDGIKHDISSRKNCLECIPFGSWHGGVSKKTPGDYGVCKNCGKPLEAKGKVFCSNECQHDFKYKEYIKCWKEKETDGIIGQKWIALSKHIRRYILEKYDQKCARCGWSEVNPFTGTIPLEIEHIDGNAKNNNEENLILLCPNCHSLTQTYRGANKGNGMRDIKYLSRGRKQ